MPTLAHILFLTTSTLLLLLSLTTLTIKSQNLSYILTNASPNDASTTESEGLLPPLSYLAPDRIAIQSAAGSTLIAIFSLVFAAFFWSHPHLGAHRLAWLIIFPILYSLAALNSLGAMGTGLIIHNSSATLSDTFGGKSPGAVFGDEGIEGLVFDVETWVCFFSGHGAGGTFESQCGAEMAGRLVTVVFCIGNFAALVVGSVALSVKRGEVGRRGRGKRGIGLFGGQGVEGGEVGRGGYF